MSNGYRFNAHSFYCPFNYSRWLFLKSKSGHFFVNYSRNAKFYHKTNPCTEYWLNFQWCRIGTAIGSLLFLVGGSNNTKKSKMKWPNCENSVSCSSQGKAQFIGNLFYIAHLLYLGGLRILDLQLRCAWNICIFFVYFIEFFSRIVQVLHKWMPLYSVYFKEVIKRKKENKINKMKWSRGEADLFLIFHITHSRQKCCK